jgi:hypothetical protein
VTAAALTRRMNELDGPALRPTVQVMSVSLNTSAYDHAKKLIEEGRFVLDERDAWSEHRPSAQRENEYLEEHGEREYARWYLAIDDEHREGTKARYKFPYGDFADVHRCGVLSGESRAGQYKYLDVEMALAHLHGMLDGIRAAHA